MKYRVTFYREAEAVDGRVPRYFQDVEADTPEAAKAALNESGIVIHSVYKAPKKAVRTRPGYLFVSPEARHKWYEQNKTKYRVSFYRKSEVVDGRAPRYMVDVVANNKGQAEELVAQPGVVIRSIYKAPSTPIRTEPSFVFETSADRNRWYSSNKTTQQQRICHDCGVNPVEERYQRFCPTCREKRQPAEKPCSECGASIPVPSRQRYCDACSTARKVTQERFHREKRSAQRTIERIEEQIAWAEKQLTTTTLANCKLSSRYQGLRIPHVFNEATRCRACLNKFIAVQNIILRQERENLNAKTAAHRKEGTNPPDVAPPVMEMQHVNNSDYVAV